MNKGAIMKVYSVLHVVLVIIGGFIATIGVLGMFGFGPGESIIALILLALIDLTLRLGQRRKPA
jgi:hypothetical protein